MTRRIANLLLVVVLCGLFAVPAIAEKGGTLLVKDVQSSVALCMVGDADGVPMKDFEDIVQQFTVTDLTRTTAQQIYQRVQDRPVRYQIGTVNKNSEIFFPFVSQGWYLVWSTAESAEFAPFLISMPIDLNGKTVYDIEAEPKVDSPVQPSVPTKPGPDTPKPSIPQTGVIQWPKYLLLVMGVLAVSVGIAEVLRGREKTNE